MPPSALNSRFNARMILYVTGILLIIEALFMLVPAAVGFCYDESDWPAFAAAAAVTATAGLLLSRCMRPLTNSMGRREGFLLTASVWIVFSLFGMLPFIFSSSPLPVAAAFFQAMSGFTTTGSSPVSVDTFSHACSLWCAMMQWIGGLGIILFTLAVLPALNSAGGMHMFKAEFTGITHDKIRPRISQTALTLWAIYAVATLLCAILLWIGPMDGFDAFCHALGTLSTGGFTTSPSGINSWHSVYVKVILVVFMTLGGINFTLIYKFISGRARVAWHDNTLRLYLTLILVSAAIFALSHCMQNDVCPTEALTIDPLFRAVSTITSSGYVTSTVCDYGSLTCALMIPLIFFGACAGSTSGGAKLDRAIVMGKFAANETRRALRPSSVLAVKVGSAVLSVEAVQKTLAFLIIYVSIIFLGGIALSAFGLPMPDALATSLSAMTNTGYNASALGLTATVQALPHGALWILSALMLIGRLEIFTILVLFLPQFWRGVISK